MAKPKVKTIRGKNPVGLQRAFDDPILVEGHADPFLLPPDDMTGDVRVVRLKDKIEALGDVVGARNLDRRTRNGNVADQAQLITPPANSIAPDINTGLRGAARFSMIL
jgi:hypothetical protein